MFMTYSGDLSEYTCSRLGACGYSGNPEDVEGMRANTISVTTPISRRQHAIANSIFFVIRQEMKFKLPSKKKLRVIMIVSICSIILIMVAGVSQRVALQQKAHKEGFKEGFIQAIQPVSNTMFFFYSNSCGFCVRAKPEWRRFVKMAPTTFPSTQVKAINVKGTDSEKAIAASYNITSYPTFIFVDLAGVPHVFDGTRTAEGLSMFVKEHLAT